MLHYYKFKNFQSFLDTTTISFEIGKGASQRGWEAKDVEGGRISTATAIFGANASGKTAALKPLAFLHWFVTSSFEHGKDEKIPLTPHAMLKNVPTEFEAQVEDDEGNVWRYLLELTRERVNKEELYKKSSPQIESDGSRTVSRFSYVFKRRWDEQSKSYDIKQKGFGLDAKQAALVRGNASLISTAAQYGVPLANLITSINFSSNVTWMGRARPLWVYGIDDSASFYRDNESYRLLAVDFMRKFDMGLADLLVDEYSVPHRDAKEVTKYRLIGKHVTNDGREFTLPMIHESSGTRSAVSLLADLLPIIQEGGMAVIDEIENDLHPDLIYPILRLFENEGSNPKRAQLLFTSHATKVMDFLGKPNIYFVEKVDCASEVYRADEIVGLRSDDNIRAKYESGALGAVPAVE